MSLRKLFDEHHLGIDSRFHTEENQIKYRKYIEEDDIKSTSFPQTFKLEKKQKKKKITANSKEEIKTYEFVNILLPPVSMLHLQSTLDDPTKGSDIGQEDYVNLTFAQYVEYFSETHE